MMIKIAKTAKIKWVVIALLAVATAGCATSGINKGDINLISSGEEVAMGQEFSVQVEQEFEVYDDAGLTAYVQSVGDKVSLISHRNDIDYHFAVIRSDEMNAFVHLTGA